jgi:hypothetical protein
MKIDEHTFMNFNNTVPVWPVLSVVPSSLRGDSVICGKIEIEKAKGVFIFSASLGKTIVLVLKYMPFAVMCSL